MSLQTRHFEFEEFRLDLAEKVLLREGTVVSVTPKVFETLQVLVENAGRLVEKDELMQRIWQDRFVEESNLSFNIKMLRKALGDDAGRPRFIETVPRRGYRFVAKVREGTVEGVAQNGPAAVSRPAEHEPARSTLKRLLLPALAILSIGWIGGSLWYARSGNVESGPPILSTPFSSEELSTNGRVRIAVISPDGKNIAYTNGLGSDRQSVWFRQFATSNNVQIIPPSDEFYFNLAFSPDGNFLYFVRGPKPGNHALQNAIYRISIFGGIATKIVDGVQGGISVSPTKISFVRCYYRDDEWCSLWIADAADGKNERKLVSLPSPFRIGDNKIAPDGRTIAFGMGQSRTGANEYGLSVVDIESGVVRELTQEKFFNINRLFWLPDQSGLLITARTYPDKHIRIRRVSAANGEISVLTKDSDDYSGLSLDRDASMLVTTLSRRDFHLNLYQADDLTKARQVSADVSTVSFAPNGKLLISSGSRGNQDIWSINSDGSEERQLTNDPLADFAARASADGAWIFFVSNRTGEYQAWRMKADGSDHKQITSEEGGPPLGISPDGKWLYYHSALQKTLRRVSIRDRQEQVVLDKPSVHYAVSPDCSQAAFEEMQGEQRILTIVSTATGQIIRTFNVGGKKAQIVGMAWSNDGKGLYYIAGANNVEETTLWVQALNESSPRKMAELPDEGLANESSFAVSPDGKSFAVVQGLWKSDAVLIKGFK